MWNPPIWTSSTEAVSSVSSAESLQPGPDVYSDLGTVSGGSTVPAGSPSPAVAGRVIIDANTTFWVRITGTAAEAGDAVLVSFEGRRVATASNPATRFLAAAGPGALGTALPEGTIEITVNSVYTDGTYIHWVLQKTPVS